MWTLTSAESRSSGMKRRGILRLMQLRSTLKSLRQKLLTSSDAILKSNYKSENLFINLVCHLSQYAWSHSTMQESVCSSWMVSSESVSLSLTCLKNAFMTQLDSRSSKEWQLQFRENLEITFQPSSGRTISSDNLSQQSLFKSPFLLTAHTPWQPSIYCQKLN